MEEILSHQDTSEIGDLSADLRGASPAHSFSDLPPNSGPEVSLASNIPTGDINADEVVTVGESIIFDSGTGPSVVTEMAGDDKWWSEEADLAFMNGSIRSCRKKGLNLWIPKILAELSDADVVYDTVSALLLRGCDVVVNSSWIIGSTTLDILGKPRSDSKTHREGRAVDVSPMYSESVILPADPSCMGLAWNFASLAAISTLVWGDGRSCFFVVEGDHLHIMLDVSQETVPGEVYVFMTMSSAYPNLKRDGSVFPLNVLRNQFFKMSSLHASLSIGTASDNERVLALLK